MDAVREALNLVKSMMRGVENDGEVLDLGARLLKKSYDALCKAGFTPEQATQIVAAQGIGFKVNT